MSNYRHFSKQIEACGSEQIIIFEKIIKVFLNDQECFLDKWSTRKIIFDTLHKVQTITSRQREGR